MRMWISALGAWLDDGSTGETRYEEDLPLCCRREAARATNDFGCPACGAAWQLPSPTEPEFCAFTYREPEGREGAA